MTPDCRFSLDLTGQTAGRARLIDCGQPTATIVDGVLIEAQFRTATEQSLLFLTGDSPYEEGLHIYLLDGGGAILDAIEAGAAYASGILAIRERTAAAVVFTIFSEDAAYELTILSDPKWRVRLAAGFQRKTAARNRLLQIQQQPRPANR